MPWQYLSKVFHAQVSLDGAKHKISKLRTDRDHHAKEREPVPCVDRGAAKDNMREPRAEASSDDKRAKVPTECFVWACVRKELA